MNTRRKKNKEKKLKSVSPPPKKEKKTTSPTCNVVTGGESKPYEKERRFYCLRREGRPNFLRLRKTFYCVISCFFLSIKRHDF